MKKIFLLVFLLIIFSIVFVNCGFSYYADLNIKVEDNGNVYISGISNYYKFEKKESDEFTSKKGSYWIFNLTINEHFSDYIIEIDLPKDIEINYIKIDGHFRITDRGKIITTGKNQKIEIILQYKFNKNDYRFEKIVYIILFIVVYLPS